MLFAISATKEYHQITKQMTVVINGEFNDSVNDLQWHPEVMEHCPNTPMVLVGTEMDLRGDPGVMENLKVKNLTAVTYEQVTPTVLSAKSDRGVMCCL